MPTNAGDDPAEQHRSAERSRRRRVGPPDALDGAAAALVGIEASPAARLVLARVLGATLQAFTSTRSVRDALPDTAAGSPGEALSVLAGIDQLRSSLAAMDAGWQVTAEQRLRRADARRDVPSSEQGRGAAGEIALARRISPAASSFSLASSRRLVQDMPGTVEALREGALSEQQASAVAGALSTASPETCRRIDEMIRQDPQTLHGKGHRRLRSDIEELVQHLEPGTSRERAERAARARHVTMTPLADGMARVTAILRGLDAAALAHSLQAQAGSLRADGAKTSSPALQADLLVDAVLSSAGSPARPRRHPVVEVGIVITDSALLGRDDDAETARIEGYGIIPAHIVRDTLRGLPPGTVHEVESADQHPDEEVSAFFRRLYRAPSTGELVAMESRSRAFPAGLARMIRWRDTTCRTPWCNAIIRQSDHVVPHHRGGPTSFANGQGLCVRCNLLKELGPWHLEPLAPQSTAETEAPEEPPPVAWAWTSPHGAQGISWTPPLLARLPAEDEVEAVAEAVVEAVAEAVADPPPEPSPA